MVKTQWCLFCRSFHVVTWPVINVFESLQQLLNQSSEIVKIVNSRGWVHDSCVGTVHGEWEQWEFTARTRTGRLGELWHSTNCTFSKLQLQKLSSWTDINKNDKILIAKCSEVTWLHDKKAQKITIVSIRSSFLLFAQRKHAERTGVLLLTGLAGEAPEPLSPNLWASLRLHCASTKANIYITAFGASRWWSQFHFQMFCSFHSYLNAGGQSFLQGEKFLACNDHRNKTPVEFTHLFWQMSTTSHWLQVSFGCKSKVTQELYSSITFLHNTQGCSNLLYHFCLSPTEWTMIPPAKPDVCEYGKVVSKCPAACFFWPLVLAKVKAIVDFHRSVSLPIQSLPNPKKKTHTHRITNMQKRRTCFHVRMFLTLSTVLQTRCLSMLSSLSFLLKWNKFFYVAKRNRNESESAFCVAAYQFDEKFKVTEEMKAAYNYDGVIMVKYVTIFLKLRTEEEPERKVSNEEDRICSPIPLPFQLTVRPLENARFPLNSGSDQHLKKAFANKDVAYTTERREPLRHSTVLPRLLLCSADLCYSSNYRGLLTKAELEKVEKTIQTTDIRDKAFDVRIVAL